MYCPVCGNKLEIHDLPPPPEIDWTKAVSDEEIEKYHTAQADHPQRKECTCSNGCFGKDYPLYFHHPLGSIDSAPGDSWSLSWVK
jgi:hypothetical protein